MEEMHYFDIDRVDKNIAFDAFYDKYFEPEKPVIIEGIGVNWLARTKWNTQYLQKSLARESSVESHKLYFTMEENTLGADYNIPDVINKLLHSSYIFPLEKNTRIWINSMNNISHWHYDSSLESVFNVQIKGKKEWYLISPQTPPPCYPYTNFVLLEDERKILGNKIFTRFTLNEGDLLYIPPLWFHKIIALEQENINLNWVMTKKKTKIISKTLIREMERYSFDNYFRYHKFTAIRYMHIKIDAIYPTYLKLDWKYDKLTETEHKLSRFYVIKMILRELLVLRKTLCTMTKIRKTFKKLDEIPELTKLENQELKTHSS